MAALSYRLIAFMAAIILTAPIVWADEVGVTIRPTGELVKLPPGTQIGEISYACKGGSNGCTISEYLAEAHVCALLVVKAGEIRLERYRNKKDKKDEKCRPDLGDDGKDKKYGIASITKSINSTLLGHAIAKKYKAVTRADFEAVLGRPMEKFISALGKGGYVGISLDRVLRMRSGVKWKEYTLIGPTDGDKFDKKVKETPQQLTIVEFAQRYRNDPSKTFNYSGLDANINGAVAQSLLAGDQKLPDFLEKTLWKEIGAGSEGRWKIDKAGTGFGACCFYLTVYDLARFGLFVLHNGKNSSGQIIPAAWFDLATRRQPGSSDEIPSNDISYNKKCPLGAFGYRYQWWLLPKRTDFTAIGINGQFLHIYPDADAFIVQISDWGKWENGSYLQCETLSLHDALIEAVK